MSLSTPPPPRPAASAAAKSHSLSKTVILRDIGYAIAVALGLIVLVSTLLLISHMCWGFAATARHRRWRRRPENWSPNQFIDVGGGGGFPGMFAGDDEHRSHAVGLQEAVLDTYPTVVFTKCGGERWSQAGCSICLGEYRESEVLRVLPDCEHRFHAVCVDTWLKLNASCPVCRRSPLTTAGSTPLQGS